MTALLETLRQIPPLLIQGALTTTVLWLIAAVISLTLGTFLGLLRSTRLRLVGISSVLDACTFVLRGVPFYVQLLISYFVLPELIGINLSANTAGTVTLGICSAAYVSQIVRGSVNAVPQGQWEAAQVLGYTKTAAIRYVIAPQMIRTLAPACAGEIDQLLKSTAVLSTIGVLELTGAAKNIIAQEMNPLTMYLSIAVVYVGLSALLTILSYYLEQRTRL